MNLLEPDPCAINFEDMEVGVEYMVNVIFEVGILTHAGILNDWLSFAFSAARGLRAQFRI